MMSFKSNTIGENTVKLANILTPNVHKRLRLVMIMAIVANGFCASDRRKAVAKT
jgi:hypothetical protein